MRKASPPDDAPQSPALLPLRHDSGHGCFGCGAQNRIGLRLKFFLDPAAGGTWCRFRLAPRFQGPHNFAHGGIIATLLDESMSKAVHASGAAAVTRHIEVDYLRPVPIGPWLEVRSRVTSVEGRKHFCEAEIRLADRELARGKAVFIAVAGVLNEPESGPQNGVGEHETSRVNSAAGPIPGGPSPFVDA